MATNDQSFQADVPLPRRSALTPDYQRDWPEYYTAVQGKPPRDTLLRALELFEKASKGQRELLAIDVGCGSGRDSHELLRRGWRVWATDFHRGAELLTASEAPSGSDDRITFVLSSMEDLPGNPQLPGAVHLVNASFSLPFCKPEQFESVWRWIGRVTGGGGRFAGQFFGDRDEWMCVRPKSHFTRAEVGELFQGWQIEHFEEIEKEGDDATGRPKYHHVFHVVARHDYTHDSVQHSDVRMERA
ncbi:MAG: class I SAM-dependent methyltransferase [Phycisphaeraceae bacterium]|nr:class I SAM-dependent methyltransferase [Phycisphaeraceae bacterium]